MFLFENTFLFALLGLFVVSALFVRTLISGESAYHKPIVFISIITAALSAASWFVQTPREHIATICRDLARLVDDGNVNEIERRLATDFEASGMNRQTFLDRLNAVLSRTRLDHVRIRGIDVVLESNTRAIATFNANCNVRSADGFAAALPSRWRLRFSKHGDHWLLQRAESIPVSPLNLRNPISLLGGET
jgi:hypothetical protein